MNTITCPNCHQVIDIDQEVAHQAETRAEAKAVAQFKAEKAALEKKQIELQDQLAEQTKVQKLAQEQALAQQELKIKKEMWEKAQEAAFKKNESEKKEQELLLKEQEERLKSQDLKLQQAASAEIEMRKRQRELEEEKVQFQLKLERALDERMNEEAEKISKQKTDQFSLKEKEMQKQIDDMKKLVEEATRKASTVSQQLQGEVMELQIEDLLRESFPMDEIAEVKKGQLGADILQTVKNSFGKAVGIIVWESKQTEHFSDKWLPKLREDTRAVHGATSVLVTRSLPDDIVTCGERDHVWITGLDFVLPLAQLLRQTLLKVQQEKTAQSGKDVKTEMLYQYINSHEFRGRVEAIVESYREMKDDLDREQRSLQNIWKKREKQILRLATNTAYMYGEMQGLVGASLPGIQGLELEEAEVPLQLSAKKNELNLDFESAENQTLF